MGDVVVDVVYGEDFVADGGAGDDHSAHSGETPVEDVGLWVQHSGGVGLDEWEACVAVVGAASQA